MVHVIYFFRGLRHVFANTHDLTGGRDLTHCHLPGRRFEVAKQHGKQGRLQIMDEQPWHDAEDGHMMGPRPRVSNSPKNKLETDLLRRGGLTLFWDLQITSDLRSWLILREQRFLKNYTIWSNSSDRKHEFWVAPPPNLVANFGRVPWDPLLCLEDVGFMSWNGGRALFAGMKLLYSLCFALLKKWFPMSLWHVSNGWLNLNWLNWLN